MAAANKPSTQKSSFFEELEMAVLLKVSRAVVRRRSSAQLMSETLEILHEHLEILCGAITLRQGDYLFIEAFYGMSDEAAKRGVYKVGEGITGAVAANGKTIIIPDISKNPNFLNRTRARAKGLKGTSFICVPITYMEQIIGTLSIDVKSHSKNALERLAELLETVSNMLADAISSLYLRQEERDKLIDENRKLKLELSTGLLRPKNMIGNCGAMQKVYAAIAEASTRKGCVFIRGNSGTGKELAARAICAADRRFGESFSVVNCAALPDFAIIAEIFGYEKNALAHAHNTRQGLLETAGGGTVFLDEVSEISLPVQALIASFLKTGTFRRLGGKDEIKPKARIIFASCDDIERLLEKKLFNADFYRRITPNTIHMPSLKDRRSDILLLSEFFLEKFNAIYGKRIKRISTPAINMLTVYSWPGNVRELENCIEHAVVSSNDSAISGYNLSAPVRAAGYGAHRKFPYGEDLDFTSMIQSFERELITEALKANRGNAAAAARKLNISERIINYKIAKYSISTSWFKPR